MAFLGISGLWLFLAPFSVFSQLLLIVHSVAGLAIVVAIPLYLWRHLGDWWRQKATAEMVLGYLLLALVVAATASGLINAIDAAFGPRLAASWDLIHLVSGLAVLALLVAHLLLAYLRRWTQARRDPELRAALRGFPRRLSAFLALSWAAVALVAALWPRPGFRHAVPADYSLPEYAQKFEEYRGNPFAPTYARTDDLRLVEPALLAHSESCGSQGCHRQILDEWEPSAHRFAAMNPPFQAVQKLFAEEREPAETRYCAGCHDPISLFAGAKDMSHQDLSAPGVDEGISCVACHAISRVDQRGNADYVLTPPARYLGELGSGRAKWLGDFLIRAYPRQHLADYDRGVLKTPEFCGTCHKQFIPEALNRFGLVAGQNQYDEWKSSRWHTDDPETDLSCRDCHMRLVTDSDDPAHGESQDRRRSEDDGAHRHHGFIATNNFIPALLQLPHWQEQTRLTEEWVRGETVLPEIAHLWPAGPVVGLQVLAPARAEPGATVGIRVVITNRKAGHNFITGPLDFIRSWVHLRALDADGRLLGEWGAIDPITRRILDQEGRAHTIDSPRNTGTLVLESLPIDETGAVLERHELWKKAGGKGTRVVFPAYSDSHRYELSVPADAAGPITLIARLNYRRYRQAFLDLVLPGLEAGTGVYQPTVTQAETARRIALAGQGAAAAGSR
ncbi:MAG: hypothetical protein MI919_15495 [Holophagales bacterium]|nr:hypothetical protein [Holophagales bacterium]